MLTFFQHKENKSPKKHGSTCNLFTVKSRQNIKLHQNHLKEKRNSAHQLFRLGNSQKTLLVILTFVDWDKCSGRAQLIKCIDFLLPQDNYISFCQFSRIILIIRWMEQIYPFWNRTFNQLGNMVGGSILFVTAELT